MIEGLMLLSLIFLLSCGVREVTITQDPFSGRADYKWNKDVLLTNNEQEQVFMYGIKLSIPDYELSFCSGYGVNVCLDKSILEFLTGGNK